MVHEFPARRLCGAIAMAVVTAGLSGCVEQAANLQASSDVRNQRVAARPGVSPSGASVAVASVEGAPASVAEKLSQQVLAQAASRDVTLVDAGQAKYLARMYLTAYPVEGGAAVSFVWDVFDGQKRRQQRIENAILLKGSAGDPWSLLNDQAIASVAGQSAEDLAAWLTNTPEAIAGSAIARATPTTPFPSAPNTGRALGFTAVR